MKEYIQKLRALADKLEELGEDAAILPVISHYIHDKEGVATTIRALGGKWTKDILGEGKDYSCIVFSSEKFPLHITISRDRVCTKKVTYECEPIFALGEDDALVEEVKA